MKLYEALYEHTDGLSRAADMFFFMGERLNRGTVREHLSEGKKIKMHDMMKSF